MERRKNNHNNKNRVQYWEHMPRLSHTDLQEEAELEGLLFGGEESVAAQFGKEERGIYYEKEKTAEEELNEQKEKKEKGKKKKEKRAVTHSSKRKAVWEDEDDARAITGKIQRKKLRKNSEKDENGHDADVTNAEEAKPLSKKAKKISENYTARMRDAHNAIIAQPEWAQDKKKDDEDDSQNDEDDEESANYAELFRSTAGFLQHTRGGPLPADKIAVRRCRDANSKDRSQAVIQGIDFHPNGNLLFTCGYDHTLRIFNIDGKENEKVQSVFFKNSQLAGGFFTKDGQQIILSSRRKLFFVYDVNTNKALPIKSLASRPELYFPDIVASPDDKFFGFLGDQGNFVLMSNLTKQIVGTVKMNGEISSAAFAHTKPQLLTVGSQGKAYLWDLRATRRCINVYEDQGLSSANCVAIDSNDRWHVIGSVSGVVNIYNASDAETQTAPTPAKAVMNASYPVRRVQFNPDDQILAMSTRTRGEGLKLMHMSTMTVFRNWPDKYARLRQVQCLAFSPNSGYLAVGNDAGQAPLFRLRHYSTA